MLQSLINSTSGMVILPGKFNHWLKFIKFSGDLLH
jgi:hypothetical protein